MGKMKECIIPATHYEEHYDTYVFEFPDTNINLLIYGR